MRVVFEVLAYTIGSCGFLLFLVFVFYRDCIVLAIGVLVVVLVFALAGVWISRRKASRDE